MTLYDCNPSDDSHEDNCDSSLDISGQAFGSFSDMCKELGTEKTSRQLYKDQNDRNYHTLKVPNNGPPLNQSINHKTYLQLVTYSSL